jgi:hypothetical protein
LQTIEPALRVIEPALAPQAYYLQPFVRSLQLAQTPKPFALGLPISNNNKVAKIKLPIRKVMINDFRKRNIGYNLTHDTIMPRVYDSQKVINKFETVGFKSNYPVANLNGGSGFFKQSGNMFANTSQNFASITNSETRIVGEL